MLSTACRLGRISLGYLAASVTAAGIASVAVARGFEPAALIVFADAMPRVAIVALVPAVIVIAHAERHRTCSVLAYVGSAAVIGLFEGFKILSMPVAGAVPPPIVIAVGTVAGAAAGLVYYVVAGYRR